MILYNYSDGNISAPELAIEILHSNKEVFTIVVWRFLQWYYY